VGIRQEAVASGQNPPLPKHPGRADAGPTAYGSGLTIEWHDNTDS
jgi:hypothetical protein